MSDREKVSFSELDKRRRDRKSGGSDRRSERAQRRNRSAVSAYKRRVEERLFGRSDAAVRSRLAERLRSAHRTPNFLRTYREYVKGFGMPEDIPLLLMLLDLDDEKEVLRVLEALRAAAVDATHDQRSLVRSRLKNMEMSADSDALADAAGAVLASL